MTLNCQTYLTRLLKRFCVASVPINSQNPAKLLKEDAEVLAFPLSNIKKLSIKLSTIPDDYKIAKSNAVFKNDSS